ncbi:MAG: molybdopterin-dependent oxidoreductase [Burkholderiales bacterium]|nr:molybdopterin-dependent oxidoreductase [Burkholderiales bacterium]
MTVRVSTLLIGLYAAMRYCAWRYPHYRDQLAERDLIAQIRVREDDSGRWYEVRAGRVRSRSGIHPNPDVTLSYETAAVAAQLLTPPIDWQQQIDCAKNFRMKVEGPDELVYRFMQLVFAVRRVGWRYGTELGEGVRRYTSMTNAGPCFVYVKDEKIVRITPIDLEAEDADPWAIEARGRRFQPPRKTTLAAHGLAWKSLVYSPDRLLYPLRRVDFDPNGERRPENRGKSDYVRIGWDEATDLVANEIRRVKTEHGPGAVLYNYPSHHSWGNVGYWTSALLRFFNAVGHTRVNHNPDSWEGWFWGAVHHWGNSMRLGAGEPYGTVADLLQEAELVVFWSSDPESTSGIYAGYEGTVRRTWLKELGIPTVHIDPYLNATAAYLGGKWIAPRPGSDTALALALAQVWIAEGLYDKGFVAARTTGFEVWKRYVMGEDDGVAKTPEWQQAETDVPARVVRALAREWGTKRTYLAAGGWGNGLGGACRGPTGVQWARAMVCLAAMQGLGRPGVNFGNLQWGTPVDTSFYFSGYGEGGFSGDLAATASSISLYQRMPHLPSVNPTMQQIPRTSLPEAIIEGKAEGFPRDARAIEGQFLGIRYPAPGHPRVRLFYRYGGSNIGTMPDSKRYIDMYRSRNLELVVNQSIWFEGETRFADVILPACTSFERWDVSEWCNSGGFALHSQTQLNHRMVVMQHKCIEPLGESKSDYRIFLELAQRLGLGMYYSEGMTELDWVQRMFESSDLPRRMSWKKFLRKGYYVVPPPPQRLRAPVAHRWFNEGRAKDVPEPSPLPSEYKRQYLEGLQTPSGKFEFECTTLKRYAPDDAERPPVLKYARSRESIESERAAGFPLQLITPHPRFSFHTEADGKGSFLNDIEDHRVRVGGRYYWVLRINPADAQPRGIRERTLVRVFNEQGAVICAARLTQCVRPGVVHGYESSARYEPLDEGERPTDRGGALNLLTPKKSQIARASAFGNSNCLVQVEAWAGIAEASAATAGANAAESAA